LCNFTFVGADAPASYKPVMARPSSTSATPLSAISVLEAAVAQVRRFGEGKTNMVDIARALGVSHAALYRFYPSKSAVMDAIVQAGMRDEEVLATAYLDADGPAGERLLGMVLELHRRKRERFVVDREVHDLHRRILVERPEIIADYAARITALVARLIGQAVERGEWRVDDIDAAAGVVRDAVTVYVHPSLVAQLLAVDAPVETMIGATVSTLARAFASGIDYN
jgi:AcrR family transcriptional regulator